MIQRDRVRSGVRGCLTASLVGIQTSSSTAISFTGRTEHTLKFLLINLSTVLGVCSVEVNANKGSKDRRINFFRCL